ncbi:hypothetical protein [Rhizosphaericola mali]|uniref:Death domain-containing protein n=1 Tax=Rhizosphaericola mali TaxID=2545455 RepID=A0A5P2G0I7_9BACT|nr:hypothetical protein [Rhizosphaericola mali]QES87352.1 hypothetical protein E0W69_001315 [Rhizosphaericola mali]
MKKYFNFLPILIVFIASCKGQTKTEKKTVHNKDFEWTINIPAGFDTVSVEKWAKIQNRGAEAIEKTYDGKVENNAKTIFVFQNDQFNYFESNYQLFDSTKDGNYLESFREVNNVIYGTFEAQMKSAKLDSSSSTQTIDGLVFQKFKVLITFPNKMVMNWQMFGRLFGKKEFTVNIMTVDRQKEKELLDCWLNSKFEK